MFNLYVPPIYVLYVHVCQKLCHKYITEIKDTPQPTPPPKKKTQSNNKSQGLCLYIYFLIIYYKKVVKLKVVHVITYDSF